jgi:hypothetical protein
MAVPFTFGSATAAIPLSQLDSNFATTITLGNTAIQLGNTVTTLNNMTLANVTISSGNVTTSLTLSGGTANGVAYLNGSKVLTTGSALTFDGTTFNAPNSVISSSSSSNALRITQTGAGNALLVEDTTNPDASPFVIDATGVVVAGNTASVNSPNYTGTQIPAKIQVQSAVAYDGASLQNYVAGTGSAGLTFAHSRSGVLGTQTVLNNGDRMGAVVFSGSDGAAFIQGAQIEATVDGTPGTNDMPGRLIFSTTADGASSPTERMRIDSAGNLGLGVTPSAWASGFKAIQIGSQAAISSVADYTLISANYYKNGSTDTFIGTGRATLYQQQVGVHSWLTSTASGTAGNAITFTQAMTLDASGNFMVGATSALGRATIVQGATSNTDTLILKSPNSGGAGSQPGIQFLRDTNAVLAKVFADTNTGALITDVNGAERARIDSSGNLLVGATSTTSAFDSRANFYSPSIYGAYGGKQDGTASATVNIDWHAASTGDNTLKVFYTDTTATLRGSITYNRGAGLIAYNVTSDYRAKDIAGPVVNSGALIDSVPVYMGKMKGATQERPMFIAHEVPAYAHTGEKDAVDADGNPVYQQMDASALIPVMWAEIQSLRQRVAQLESN